MGFYRDFHRNNIDLKPLGVVEEPARTRYFCSPRGATVIGTADNSGIHYCFVKDYDEMVFEIGTQDSQSGYVHAIARDFKDFLRLLLACGSPEALSGIYRAARQDFERLRVAPDSAVAAALAELDITPMEDPFDYVSTLRREFDSKGNDNDNPISGIDNGFQRGWRVFFGKDFCETGGASKPCTETRLTKNFEWCGGDWTILSVYMSIAGLVLDIHEPRDWSRSYDLEVVANGQIMSVRNSFKVQITCDNDDITAQKVRNHYQLSGDDSIVRRWNLNWLRRRRSELRSLTLKLTLPETGESIDITLR